MMSRWSSLNVVSAERIRALSCSSAMIWLGVGVRFRLLFEHFRHGATFLSRDVNLAIACNLVNPCRHLCAVRIELVGLTPDSEQDILHDLVGFGVGGSRRMTKPFSRGAKWSKSAANEVLHRASRTASMSLVCSVVWSDLADTHLLPYCTRTAAGLSLLRSARFLRLVSTCDDYGRGCKPDHSRR